MTIRVLLADDHAMMREGLSALLSKNPDMAIVAEVSNGRDAVQVAQEVKADVVVMDLAMPELNGIEATRQLAKRCVETRVVILSMHSSSEHVFRAFEAGAVGYVLKDSIAAELNAAVRTAYSGGRYLSRAISGFSMDVLNAARQVSPLDSLSERERQVLQLVVEGHSSAQIAELVHLSRKSVETYRSRLMKKLGVSDFPALVKFAIEHGLTPPG